jgi:hypothetical protein
VGPLAYVAANDSGLRVIDVSNPALPVEIGAFDVDFAVGVSVVGTRAYVAYGDAGLRVIDAVAIPEPGAWLLQLVAGSILLGLRARRRREA